MQKRNGINFNELPFNKVISLIKQNDTAILKKLYVVNFPKVRRYILKNSGNEQQAKDVYQEAFIAMWRNIKNNRFSANKPNMINGYLFQIAKYKWLDHLRSVKYKNTTFINREIEYDEPNFEIDDHKNHKIKLIMDCISNLGDRCQTLLKLFYFERRTYKEIAQILKIDEASARNAKYRCQEQLKKMTQTIPNGNK
ncbi:sigma-70 family RNA polymerase sigma factor [Aequorivita sp. F47161]|uniref:Sigma-70 family RNA polymerase sigma factor n=1 Tax=Aequorivita vitellina TaxID=2874475 RepID=A0A9X1U4G1_9FLAO|nr:sigma-70 family RNA polymerase sigma factor [Aequorivita vitellina]MCG2420272.1 sigma-70 family RNA polymerase sigma factor [Aequorivita vitellina]MCZ4317782.1 sigma-70 family RNA polymerase sigma factor [Aequorivita viscosa]